MPVPARPTGRSDNNQKGELIPMSVVSMRELLEAGVHFGHQTRRWNPKMRRFIFTERGGIYIIDLQQTLQLLEEAHAFARNLAERGGSVLFVGTKKQSQGAVEEQAKRVNMPYVSHRWLGGLLTNWRTISDRIDRLHELRRPPATARPPTSRRCPKATTSRSRPARSPSPNRPSPSRPSPRRPSLRRRRPMAEISAALVKELRDQTGAPMMDCKRALQETNGDMEAAVRVLREKGMAGAAKRSDRATPEGKVGYRLAEDAKRGTMVAVGRETEPVSNNDEFLAFAKKVLEVVEASGPGAEAALDEERAQLAGKLGENVAV